jgi:hypothetical protein
MLWAQVRYMFPRQVLPLLPESDDTNATKRFTTCAVVGNSGRMLASKAGDEIDAHQVGAPATCHHCLQYGKHSVRTITESKVNLGRQALKGCGQE